MADNILDIVQRINYEADTTAIEIINDEFGDQLELINKSQQKIEKYSKLLSQLSADQQRQATIYTGLIEREQRQVDKLTTSIGQQIGANKKLSNTVVDLSGKMKNLSFAGSQLVREAPAFAFSLQTGLIGISNNIPILIDQLNAAKAAGAGSKEIFKALGASVFGLTGIISIAIPLLINFGDKLFGAGKDGESAKEGIDAATKAIKSQIDEIEKYNTDVANIANQGQAALKREIDAIKSKGVVNGEVFAHEQELFIKEQGLRKKQKADAEESLKVYEKIQTAISMRSGRREGDINPDAPTIEEALAFAPTALRESILQAKKDGVDLESFIDRSVKDINEKIKDSQNAIDAAQTEFTSKLSAKQYQLIQALNKRIEKGERELSKERIDAQQETSETILQSLDLDRKAKERELDLEIEDARKNGTLTVDIERKFNKLRQQARKEFEQQFERQNLEFLIKQVENADKVIKVYEDALNKFMSNKPFGTGVVSEGTLPELSGASASTANAILQINSGEKAIRSKKQQLQLQQQQVFYAKERQKAEIKIAEALVRQAKETGEAVNSQGKKFSLSEAKDYLKEQKQLLRDLNAPEQEKRKQAIKPWRDEETMDLQDET